jgi:FRG domain
MICPTEVITDWSHLMDVFGAFANKVPTPTGVDYLFRGQSDAAWPLAPSLKRLLGDLSIECFFSWEQDCVNEFRSLAHLYFPSNLIPDDNNLPGWWSLMQHYGAPTRLLDWSASPYVATYFSVGEHDSRDGAVWMFWAKDLTRRMDDQFGLLDLRADQSTFQNPSSPAQLLIFRRILYTERMNAQQGWFTACRRPTVDHNEAIESVLLPDNAPRYRRFVIPSHLKMEFLRRLRAMNISANSLFPGIDGVGRSVVELMRMMRSAVGQLAPTVSPPS